MFVRPLLLLLLVVPGAPPVHAEIYACAGKHRLTVYQNFPCQFDRADAVTAPADARADAAGANFPQGPRAPRPVVPRVGMSTEEVRAIWGEPKDMTTEEHAKRDIERWTYADSRSVVFDRKGIVTSIHW
jgi:hypothetical protein